MDKEKSLVFLISLLMTSFFWPGSISFSDLEREVS